MAQAPRASFEELEIHTVDGVALRAVVEDPPEGVVLRGTCVLAHAMFARKSSFGRRDRPGLAQRYAAEGWRTIAFDFRGHGESTLPVSGAWGYDDLVRSDLPAVVACARARSEGMPVVVVGHSLGGHVALASEGTGRLAADGIVAVATTLWLRSVERSRLRWTAQVAAARGMREAASRFGRLPARRFRFGSDDESGLFIGDVLRFIKDDAWRSADETEDYLASLARVTIPVCSVASDGDRFICHPESAAGFARRCGGAVESLRVVRADDGGPPPGHMAIVTTPSAASHLVAALRWIHAELDAARSGRR